MKTWAPCLFFVLAANQASAIERQDHPTLVCAPTAFKRLGTDDGAVLVPEQQVFEFIGNVQITKNDGGTKYVFGKEGTPAYTLRQKYPFSDHLLSPGETYLVVPEVAVVPIEGRLALRSDDDYQFFQFNYKTGQYHGYVTEYDGVNTFSGSCVTQLRELEK